MTAKGHGPTFCEHKGTTAEGSRAAGRLRKNLDFRVEPQPTLPHNLRPDAPGSMPLLLSDSFWVAAPSSSTVRYRHKVTRAFIARPLCTFRRKKCPVGFMI